MIFISWRGPYIYSIESAEKFLDMAYEFLSELPKIIVSEDNVL